VKKIIVTLLVICCSTVVYATSVSVMITAPKLTTTGSVAVTPTDVSAILTVIYGEYPQVYGKGGVDYETSALSTSFQQGVTHSNGANMGIGSARENITADESDDVPLSTPIPEPNNLLLVGIGLAGLGIAIRFRR
jgi:hypothetical protein